MSTEKSMKKITLDRVDQSIDSRIRRKLVQLTERKDPHQRDRNQATGEHFLREQSEVLGETIVESEAVFEALPDLKLAMRVLVSGILSPNDLMGSSLHFTLNESVGNTEFTSSIIGILEEHFTKEYPLEKILSEILEDVLFNTGSYPLAILPESTIDEVIDSDTLVGNESMAEELINTTSPLGLLHTKDRSELALESMRKNSNGVEWLAGHFCILDNFNALKKPHLVDKFRSQQIMSKLTSNSIGFESQKEKSIYVPRRYKHVPLQHIKADKNKLGGNPVIMRLPSVATIPVHVPGDPTNHVGFFVLLDETGHPLSNDDNDAKRRHGESRGENDGEKDAAELIKKTYLAMRGEEQHERKNKVNFETYVNLIEQELEDRLTKGMYQDGAVLADITTVATIMFSRALVQKRSSILFIPSELVTYFAFEHSPTGVGKSLLARNRIISGIRTVLMLSNVMGSVRNSVPRTGVGIELDPEDRDPSATIEFLMSEFFRGQGDALPLWENNPADVVKSIQRSSVDVVVSGNSKYPQTRMEVIDKTRTVAKPDSDLEKEMRRRHYMSMGLPPEMLDAEMNVEFATSLISSNVMLAKEIALYQQKFTRQLDDFIRKYVRFNPMLQDKIKVGLSKFKKKDMDEDVDSLATIIEAINVSLPAPDTKKLDMQIKAYEQFSTALDQTFAAYFNEGMFGRVFGNDLEESVQPTIAIMKSYFLRRWLRLNNVLPELEAIVDVSDKEAMTDFNEVHERHLEAFIESSGDLFRNFRKHSEKIMLLVDEDKANADARRRTLEDERYAESNPPVEGESGSDPIAVPEEEPVVDSTTGDEEVPDAPVEDDAVDVAADSDDAAATDESGVPAMPA